MGLPESMPTFRQIVDWLDKDGGKRVFCVGGRWYSRRGWGQPHRRHGSLAEAAVHAMSSAEPASYWACVGERSEPPNDVAERPAAFGGSVRAPC